MAPLSGMDGMRLERHAIADGGRSRWSVASEMCEGLAWKMRGHHGRIHDVAMWRGSVLIIFVVIVVCAAVEVGRSLVFVWATELLLRPCVSVFCLAPLAVGKPTY